jgi:phasin family protein
MSRNTSAPDVKSVHPRQGISAMSKPPVEPVATANTDALAKTIAKGNADALANGGNASTAALQQLGAAYQELATKNVKKMTAAMQALATVKSPTEFIELQQKLVKESLEAAVRDSQHIAQLTSAVFTTAFEPVKRQMEAVQKRVTS